MDSGADRLRRMGYGAYSGDSYSELARLALGRQVRALKVHEIMEKLRKNGLSALSPEFIEVRAAIASDIPPPSLDKVLRNLLQLCLDGSEFECVNVDCGAQPTFRLVEKVGRKKKMSTKKSQVSPNPRETARRECCPRILWIYTISGSDVFPKRRR